MVEKKPEGGNIAMLYPFNALLARMKYITRWSLMLSLIHISEPTRP